MKYLHFLFVGSSQKIFAWVMAHKVLTLVALVVAWFVSSAVLIWGATIVGNFLGKKAGEFVANFPFVLAVPFLLFPPTALLGGFIIASALFSKILPAPTKTG